MTIRMLAVTSLLVLLSGGAAAGAEPAEDPAEPSSERAAPTGAEADDSEFEDSGEDDSADDMTDDGGVADASDVLLTIIPEVRFEGVSLEEAFDQLREATHANIVVDWAGLAELGVKRDTVVRVRLWDVTLSTALDVLLSAVRADAADPLGDPLGFIADGEIIRVSSQRLVQGRGVIRIYDVRDLLTAVMDSHRSERPVPSGDGNTRYAYHRADAENLVNILREQVDPDTWREHGGTSGSLREWGGRLIVSQTPQNHAQIERLLAQLRESFSVADPSQPGAAAASNGEAESHEGESVAEGRE